MGKISLSTRTCKTSKEFLGRHASKPLKIYLIKCWYSTMLMYICKHRNGKKILYLLQFFNYSLKTTMKQYNKVTKTCRSIPKWQETLRLSHVHFFVMISCWDLSLKHSA